MLDHVYLENIHQRQNISVFYLSARCYLLSNLSSLTSCTPLFTHKLFSTQIARKFPSLSDCFKRKRRNFHHASSTEIGPLFNLNMVKFQGNPQTKIINSLFLFISNRCISNVHLQSILSFVYLKIVVISISCKLIRRKHLAWRSNSSLRLVIAYVRCLLHQSVGVVRSKSD